jgi:hypothetical protein
MMRKKAIALVLALVVAAWSEMAVAPMLAMHAGHMLAGHEMAADMPSPQHAHHHAQLSAEQAQGNSHRPCCPGLRGAQTVIVIEVVSAAPGCDDSDSCCFRQGPQSVPAAADSVQNLRRDATPAPAVEAMAVRPVVKQSFNRSLVAISPPPDVFGMTLRV